jgi:Domain of unknown function (DUF4430)
MRRLPAIRMAVVLALVAGATAVGCGPGPGEASEGQAHLSVTREFGTVPMAEVSLSDPTESDTVVRFLDANAEIETSYGGNFVDSIDGFAGSTSGGGDEDWFFFVNGYYSDIGAGETAVRPGDRIWWDFRYWNAAYRVPAVVGSWPEPFLHGSEGKAPGTIVECVRRAASDDACDEVISSLREIGVAPEVEAVSEPVVHTGDLRVLVGSWDRLRSDSAVADIEAGPERSGVYARMVRCGGGWRLIPEDERGQGRAALPDAGLIAAVRRGEDQPTWVVTGTDADAVAAAAGELSDASLGDRYAVVVNDGVVAPLPVPADGRAPVGGGCQ